MKKPSIVRYGVNGDPLDEGKLDLPETVINRAPLDAPEPWKTILLTATSDGTAAVGGFNSASKTFSVIRD